MEKNKDWCNSVWILSIVWILWIIDQFSLLNIFDQDYKTQKIWYSFKSMTPRKAFVPQSFKGVYTKFIFTLKKGIVMLKRLPQGGK